jgi:hypothetical protein
MGLYCQNTIIACFSLGGLLLGGPQGLAVTWDAQAERLQKVSASFLDASPLFSEHQSLREQRSIAVQAKSVVSVLPKMNATVGAKTEQPPQPPAHAIPTLELASSYRPYGGMHLGVRGWFGVLPSQAAQTTGMKAKCGQQLLGASVGGLMDEAAVGSLGLDVGMQRVQTQVTGGITAEDAADKFLVTTQQQFVAVTWHTALLRRLWVQGMILERSVKTHFEIPSDGTVFDLTDESKIGSQNAATQWAIGYGLNPEMQIAFGYVNVPQRSSMPRILMSYNLL